MPIDLILPLSITLALITWTLVVVWYVQPWISRRGLFQRAIEIILIAHTLRYVGLMFLLPGVTSAPLDPRFAHPAAYGDLIAALLALVALVFMRNDWKGGRMLTYVFNLFGLSDLINAVVRGILYSQDGHLGATFWIPATIVPVLVVSHFHLFFLLAKPAAPDANGISG